MINAVVIDEKNNIKNGYAIIDQEGRCAIIVYGEGMRDVILKAFNVSIA